MQSNPSKPSADVLRLIAKNLTEMVMAYDLNRKLVFVNPAVETLTGYTVEDLEKANFICWIHPEDQARMMAFWESLFQGKSFHEEEYRLITRDGRVKWVVASWTPLLDDSGVQVGVQGREFDITQRKMAETALRHSEEKLRVDEQRYRVLFEDSPFPMWEEDFSGIKSYLDSLAAAAGGDMSGYLAGHPDAVRECVTRVRVLDVNRAARDFYGASSKEELLGSLDRIFDEHACDVFREEMGALYDTSAPYQTEFGVRTLKGEERLVDMIVSVVDSARSDWSRVIVSFFDITDRKRLEEQFLQSQKMESLGRLAGGVAHDFNNLLTVINGYADFILRRIEEDNPFRGPLTEIRGAGERCADLTQQLLAFSRKQVVQSGPLDLNGLIRESLRVLDRVLGDDVRVETHLAPNLGAVEADRTKMHQVLLNLAANARDAMPTGGVLTIETQNVPDRGEVLLEVRDTGPGIEESAREHLFEPFFSTKPGSKNTGLGLAIVFGVVTQSGGRIEVHSEPGAGAAFRIYLPRIPGRADMGAPAEGSRKTHRGAGTVLVVDDRDDVRTMVSVMLRELGYETVEAAGGREALSLAGESSHPFPLLVTDVVMPGMNGRELADQFRHLYPETKTIFMSGYTDRVLADREMPERQSAYLQKPFTLTQLADALRRVTGAE